jgi:CheY-like chemotaxis protein
MADSSSAGAPFSEHAQHLRHLEELRVQISDVTRHFNNLIHSILGFADLGMTALPPTTEAYDCFLKIEEAARRASELSRRIQTLAKQERDDLLSLMRQAGVDSSWTVASAAAAPPSPVIVVVDDEEMVRALAAKTLERAGYRVLQARSGQECLALVERVPDAQICVLLDLVMPGMNGAQTLERLHTLRPKMPVVVSTGFSLEEVTERFPAMQIQHFLQKPYVAMELVNAIRKALDSAPPSPGVVQ